MELLVEVRRLQSIEQVAAVEPQWEDLLARSDVESPFLTLGWQLAWLESYGVDHEPFVLVARNGERLLGLWPLALQTRGPWRVLLPIGSGRSDWLDVLAMAADRERVIAAFKRYLEEHRADWDLIELRDVLADSPSIGWMEHAGVAKNIFLRRRARSCAPYLELTGTWDGFLASKRPKFRSNLKYYDRLATRDGLTIVRPPDQNAGDIVDALAFVESGSWKARSGNIKINTKVGRDFYQRFCSHFAERGWLEIWSANREGRPVALLVNFVLFGKCYHYNTCYREEVAHLSPGLLLHARAIADAFQRRLREYDFLSGDEPYKRRWCAGARQIEHLAFFHRSPRSISAYIVLVKLRWILRKIRPLARLRQGVLAHVRRAARPALQG